jgi:ferredoxin-type protein NapH
LIGTAEGEILPRKHSEGEKIELPILQSGGGKSPPVQPKAGRGRIRALVLLLVHLLILAHVAHYWYAGRTLSPVEPSESMYMLEMGHVNAGAIFFGLAILSTAIFGRFFCGWGCHLVALQDLSGYLLKRIGFRPKPLRSRMLTLVPFVLAFYMFFWPTVARLWMGIPHPGFSNHLVTQNFWQTFPGPLMTILTFLVCGGLIVYLLGNKGFCTYACPYGAFFSVADRMAVGRIYVTDACLHCGQCTAHCTSNVQVHTEVKDFGMVVDPGCMKCMDCVSVCPNEALYFGFKPQPGPAPARLALPVVERPKSRMSRKKNYDYSLPEELLGLGVAAGTVFGLRGLYDLTPLLLSVTLAVITAYWFIQAIRVWRRADHRMQNIQLKRQRHLTRAGWLASLALLLWSIFVMHSIFVQYHRYRGRSYISRSTASWTELVTGLAQSRQTPESLANADRGLSSYRWTDQFGLVPVKEAKIGMAIGSLIKNDFRAAEIHLRQAYRIDPPGTREMLIEFLVSQNRWDEAMELGESVED